MNLTLEQKIGQILCVGFPETEISDEIKDLIRNYHIGNIILFARNYKDRIQLFTLIKELQKTALEANGLPLFITIDQEGGYVTRLFDGAAFFPGAMATAATGNPENAYLIGKNIGEELKALGINFNLAPVLDINTNPENPVINVRSYGDTKEIVTEYALEYTKGLQENVIATGKHFPGHGDTHLDSHLTLPTVSYNKERLENEELYPFKKLIENGIRAIMSSHIIFPAYEKDNLPATMSKSILTGLLREQLGFSGLIVTDCMEMKAIDDFFGTVEGVTKALYAGANIIIVSHTREKQISAFNGLKEAVINDKDLRTKLDDSVKRIIDVKNTLPNSVLLEEMLHKTSWNEHKEASKQISRKSLTLLRGKALPFKEDETFFAFFFTAKKALTGIENQKVRGDFEDKFKAIFENARLVALPINPSCDEIHEKLQEIKSHDRIVIFSYSAATNPGQACAISKILDKNPNALVIAMRSPYDIRRFGFVKNYVMAYEYTPLAIDSVLNLLKGDFVPAGKPPIDVLKGI